MSSLFGSRNPRPTPPRQQPQPGPGSYNRVPSDNSGRYGGSHGFDGSYQEKYDHTRGASRGGSQTWQLQPTKSPHNQFTYGNMVAVSPFDFPQSRPGSDFYLILNDLYVCTARVLDNFQQAQISLSDFQRSWASISLQDTVNVKIYDPFQEGGHRYLGSLDAEVSFAGKKETDAPFDQDELQQFFTKVSRGRNVYVKNQLNRIRITKTKCLLPVKEFSWIIRASLCFSSLKPSSWLTYLWTKHQLVRNQVCLIDAIVGFLRARVR